MKHLFNSIAYILLSHLAVIGQDTIPFQLTSHNNIAIQGVLNGTDTVSLMFHTAAGSVTLIEEATERLSSVKWNAAGEVNSWGGSGDARISEQNTLQLADFSWRDVSIWENTNSGPGTDGKFGPNLFADMVIELDFDHNLLIIYQKLPAKTNSYEKLALKQQDDMLFIKASSSIGGVDYYNDFLIHSGYAGAILYDDQFADSTSIGKQITITGKQELKDSYGNVVKVMKGSLPGFSIGNETLTDVPVGFFEGTIGRQQVSVLGGDLIKRFNLIIDADRSYIYLKSNKLSQLPFKNT